MLIITFVVVVDGGEVVLVEVAVVEELVVVEIVPFRMICCG